MRTRLLLLLAGIAVLALPAAGEAKTKAPTAKALRAEARRFHALKEAADDEWSAIGREAAPAAGAWLAANAPCADRAWWRSSRAWLAGAPHPTDGASNVMGIMFLAQAQAVAAPYRDRMKPFLDRLARFRFSDPTLNAGAAHIVGFLRVPLSLPAFDVCGAFAAWEQTGFTQPIAGAAEQQAASTPDSRAAVQAVGRRVRTRLVQIGIPDDDALVWGTTNAIGNLIGPIGSQWRPDPEPVPAR